MLPYNKYYIDLHFIFEPMSAIVFMKLEVIDLAKKTWEVLNHS